MRFLGKDLYYMLSDTQKQKIYKILSYEFIENLTYNLNKTDIVWIRNEILKLIRNNLY